MVGMGSQTKTPAEHMAKHDPRFHALLSSLECHENTISRLGELNITSTSALTTLVDTRVALRKFLKVALGLDEDAAGLDGITNTLEQGKVVLAWEQACKRMEVDIKRDAVRLSSNLPPQILAEEVFVLKKQFEQQHNRNRTITKAQTPSKAYLELKMAQAETMWAAEKLSEVTSLAQAERHRLSNVNEKHMAMDQSGDTCSFKIVTKPFAIAMPSDSEGLRARLKLLGHAFIFLRLHFPTKGVLATATRDVFYDYTEFLFGDDVWNFTTKGEHGLPNACPHQGLVMDLDFALREKVAELMSSGVDIAKAFDDVMGDMKIRQTAFLCNFAIENGSARCRALTAPAFLDIHGMGAGSPSKPGGAKRGLLAIADGSVHTPLSKAAKRKARREANGAKGAGGKGALKKARLNLAEAQAALSRANASTAGAAGASKGGGGAAPAGTGGAAPPKGQSKGASKTKAGQMICFSFNNGKPCKQTPCNMAHVCQMCEGNHPKTSPECPFMKRIDG